MQHWAELGWNSFLWCFLKLDVLLIYFFSHKFLYNVSLNFWYIRRNFNSRNFFRNLITKKYIRCQLSFSRKKLQLQLLHELYTLNIQIFAHAFFRAFTQYPEKYKNTYHTPKSHTRELVRAKIKISFFPLTIGKYRLSNKIQYKYTFVRIFLYFSLT